METATLPPHDEMLEAFLARDAEYDGMFLTGVRTTGIFCRPVCTARKPLPQHVEFFPTARAALSAGFRPCRRCRPLETPGATPAWLAPLLDAVDRDPARRWTDADLRALDLSPARVRRWFKAHHGMTFHAYSRARRLGTALGRIRQGEPVTAAAFDAGYESLSGFHDAFRQLLGAAPTAARDTTVVHVTRIATPLGPMLAGATDEALCLLEFVDRRMLVRQLDTLRRRLDAAFVPGENDVIARAADEVARYFGGTLSQFTGPVTLPGTAFQQDVWAALCAIPYGATRSYADIARAVGRPQAVRAVARANGDNRLAIVVPCHRVVGADGRLTGYGGGLWRKERLLALEQSRGLAVSGAGGPAARPEAAAAR